MIRIRSIALLTALAYLGACSNGSSDSFRPAPPPGGAPGATPKAQCGPGSRPETDLQGRVSLADHDSGRAAEGYTCNTELVGAYTIPNALGTVGGFKVERYVDPAGRECAYYDTTLLYPTNLADLEAGVNVLDMSDPAQPALTERLLTPAMLSPHESLVLSQVRGLLVAVLGNPVFGPGVVDVYDVSGDCRHPALKSSTPFGILGHESGLAPDGRTFYAAALFAPTVTAVDISDPALPRPLAVLNFNSHGLSLSEDGNRAYLAGRDATRGNGDLNPQDTALIILDVSEIQARQPNPAAHEIARLQWTPQSTPQNAIPITIKGRPYVVEIDEFGTLEEVGAGRIIDIGDERNPRVISDLRLAVHQPENFEAIADDPGAGGSLQGYAGHYCNVPTRVDPPIVACTMILSGLRVFDIRDPHHPREVAYFNAPANPRLIAVPNPTSSYAMASPAFVPERKEIWYSDGHSGFYAVRVTNGAWP